MNAYASNDRNCRPNQYCKCKVGTSWAFSGAALKEIELRRHQATNWYFPPLRFPGQYFDAETDLHENWNRFYDPQTGRYLSPEPMLQRPARVKASASKGLSLPTYAYALNNPLYWYDPTGLDPTSFCRRNPDECDRNARELAFQQCRCKRAGGTFEINVADPTPGTSETAGDEAGELIIGGSCDIGTKECPNLKGWSSNLMTDLDHFLMSSVASCP